MKQDKIWRDDIVLMVFSFEDVLDRAKENDMCIYNDGKIVITNKGIKETTSGTYEEYTVLRRIDRRSE